MSPDVAELLHRHRRTIAALESQVRLMEAFLSGSQEAGAFGTHNGHHADTTAASIAQSQAQIEELRALVDRFDPEGFTVLERAWPVSAGA